MIKANELRIGNWIKDIEGSELEFQVEARHIARSAEFPCFRPIRLTYKGLVALGFDTDHSTFEFVDGSRKGNIFITWWDNEFVFESENAGKLTHLTITSIHQLQNLFFSLTCEELIYKP